jgi:hypothetical protein
MKTLETPTDQIHLLNYGFEPSSGLRLNNAINTIHVQFNKATGQVETIQAIGYANKSNYADVTDLLTENQKAALKTHARKQYELQYGYAPENQPASDN